MSAPTLERPTTIGWWWRIDPEWGTRDCVEVTSLERGPYGGWLCEVPTPERIAADAERLERVTQMLATDIPEAFAMFERSRSEYDRGLHNGLVMARSALNGDEP